MIPELGNGIESIANLPETPQPLANKTYKIDWFTKTITGYLEEIEALRQTIYCILNSERYEYEIYSYDYGVELKELLGEDHLYIKADLHRRIEEALLQDDRIISLDTLNITSNGDSIHYEGKVTTVFGEIEINREVV
ncbi:MAG TPA: DUF2634 domain-containing protein [Clostridium sp.]|nr:DUF2634 domain-containing protein [Clostridium sp.]